MIEDIKKVLDMIHNTIVFDVKDYSISRRDRLIYGLIVGWDDASLEEFGLTCEKKKVWKDLHKSIDKFRKQET